MDRKPDFSGYATKAGIRCSDGRTITPNAFSDSDGKRVPLVWQHMHNDPNNILGHAILENRKDGVYANCFFNETDSANQAKALVKHGDITSLSIFANSLVEKNNLVIHGVIRELSLVLSGANEGALIDYVSGIQHADGSFSSIEDSDDAVIYSGENFELGDGMLAHADDPDDTADPEDPDDSDGDDGGADGEKTIKEVFETMTKEQQAATLAMVDEAHKLGAEEAKAKDMEAAAGEDAKHSDIKGDQKVMKKNVFDGSMDTKGQRPHLTHAEVTAIVDDAVKMGSFKKAFLAHAGNLTATYGVENIDFLFPDPKNVTPTPTFIKRDTLWVKDVFGAAHHTPFSRIKTIHADITMDEARAKGYIKGKQKAEEVIALLKRTTIPTTIYKKQKLDRDDVIDITDMDVVSWLKSEMRMMLEEEIARAMLVGDGRSPASDDKVNEDRIRPIYTDNDLYSVKVRLEATDTTMQIIDNIIRARKDYKGSGNPVFFSTPDIISDMLLLKDTTGRRLYNTINDLAAALRVTKIIEVPVMENLTRTLDDGTAMDLLGIIVNMTDYYLGADKGGQISMFDDFDIDFNQYKYLIETRCSGALVLPHSALVVEQVSSDQPAPKP